MQERFIAAVDLGDSKISLSVCQVVDGIAEVVHYREAESRGIRRGTIFNPKQVCEPLARLIREAEEALDINIRTWNEKAVYRPQRCRKLHHRRGGLGT